MSLETVWRYALRKLYKSQPARLQPRASSLSFEGLEQREMLSVTPPTVTEVAVSSTQWSNAFYDYLAPVAGVTQATEGYKIPVGSIDQTKTLPWENIDQVQVAFSEDVHVDAADFAFSGINHMIYQFDEFHYDAQSHVATLTFANPFPTDQLMIDLDADGLDPVADLDGNVLDGDWTDNVTSGPSGNGTAGGDFEFRFNVAPGDVDQNQYVVPYDYIFTRARDGQDTSGPNYTPFHDINGSGVIDTTDWLNVIGHIGNHLPSGQPSGVTNDAPTTTGFDLVELNDPAANVTVSLFDAFEDAEDPDNQLTFTIVGNTDPSLLDTLSIDSTTGVLTISAAANVTGRTFVTIQASDSQWHVVESDIPIDVNRTNLPPMINNYLAIEFPGNTWLFTGYVTDPDDDVDGWIVEFSGVFETRATVDENGYFEFAVILEEDDWGYEWAITSDPWGIDSNNPGRLVGLT